MTRILTGKTVLVTGGTGSIGSEIVKQALEEGAREVIIFSRDEIKHFMMKNRIQDSRLRTVIGDTRNARSVEQVFSRFDIDFVYHAAAMKHVVMCEHAPEEAVETNILGTRNVVDMALKYGVSGMITVSTDKAAYPVNIMGATKFIAERITLNGNRFTRSNQKFSCVRLGNVACSRGSVIPVFVDSLLYRKPLQVTDPEVTRFILEIPDAVKLIIKATEYSAGGEIFILKMRSFKLGDLVDVLLDRIIPRLNLMKEDIEISVTGLVSGEKLHESLANEEECSRLYEMPDMYLILPDEKCQDQYPGLCKAGISKYNSNDVKMISADEMENIVVKHLKSLNALEAGRTELFSANYSPV